MVDQQTLDAFEQMWGPFPEPVLLVHKNRTILARNEVARRVGVSAGAKCYSLALNSDTANTVCKQCKANFALREHKTVCSEDIQNGMPILSFWMPLKAEQDVYVHFGVGCAKAAGIDVNSPSSEEELVSIA